MKTKFGAAIEGWKNFPPSQFSVAGIQFRRSAAEQFIRGCELAHDKGLQARAILKRDRFNLHDGNAIKVIGCWESSGFFGVSEKSKFIGFVPAEIDPSRLKPSSTLTPHRLAQIKANRKAKFEAARLRRK